MNVTDAANDLVTIDYTNYRGERGIRRIKPMRIEFRSSHWHPEPQWLLIAIDMRQEQHGMVREFAMAQIHSFSIPYALG